jgi:hypothetical protein
MQLEAAAHLLLRLAAVLVPQMVEVMVEPIALVVAERTLVGRLLEQLILVMAVALADGVLPAGLILVLAAKE